MNKKVLGKIFGMIFAVVLAISSVAFAVVTSGTLPKFNSTKFGMELGTTQSLSGIINVQPSEFYKITTSNPSVVKIENGSTLKAVSTGISTLSYTYTDAKGKSKEIYCYVEVSKNNSTYSEIDGSLTTKINITLELGGYTTVFESPVAAIPKFPEVKKDGYILEGWYRDSAFSSKVTDRDRFSSDITLYARWITEAESNKPVESHSELFDDIDYHWAKNYIESVTYKGLFNGVSEKMFGPDLTMTRAMVITVLARLEEVEKTGRTTSFTDVPAGAYYEEYVAWGVENKIVSGTSENEFSPNKEITREEMAVMMANYVKYKKYDYELEQVYFSDADSISSWAVESVKILNNLGIMQGNADGTYNPRKVTTRAEIATVFYNYLNFLNKQ